MDVNILPLGLAKLLLEMYPANTIEQLEKDIPTRIFTETLFIFFLKTHLDVYQEEIIQINDGISIRLNEMLTLTNVHGIHYS